MYHAHPVILFHIFAATLGLLSGYMAMFLRKGSGLHGAAGTIFFVSMAGMSLSGAYGGAFIKPVMINIVAGLVTFYLVTTAWRAGRRRDGATDLFDRIGLVYIAIVAFLAFFFGITKPGPLPAAIYFIFGAGALWSVRTDIKMLRRGGLYGPDRIRRHLWRMMVALLIATMSFYPGQARLFQGTRATAVLFLPHLFLIGSMIYWTFKMRARRKATRVQPQPADSAQIPGGIRV